MRLTFNRMLLLLSAVAFMSSVMISCKAKVKDEDIQANIQTALRADPETAGVTVEVKNGVATLAGEAKDETTRAKATETAKRLGGSGVKSVENNVTVAQLPEPPASVQITADDSLTMKVKDATKDHPTVTATVKDGVVSLSGEIKRDKWKKLKQDLDGLKPKRIDPAGLKISN
jgi:hyperosmotically inducible protein